MKRLGIAALVGVGLGTIAYWGFKIIQTMLVLYALSHQGN